MIPRSPGGGHGNSLQYSCLENPHGQGSLAGYSPWGCKESDTTDQLSTEHILISIFKMLSNVLEELLWARWVAIKDMGKMIIKFKILIHLFLPCKRSASNE